MASFLDNPNVLGSFTPYQPEEPVQALVDVGMEKQNQFYQGVQRVQGYVDYIASLPLAKQEYKDYMNAKLGQLKQAVSTSIASDFSDQRLINQIGGLTKQVGNDPTIQRGVTYTMQMQANDEQMTTDKKNGKYNPANEGVYQMDRNAWLNDHDINSPFTASYSTPTDPRKKWQDAAKAIDPNAQLTDLPFLMDSAGNYVDKQGNIVKKPVWNDVMIEKSVEGKSIEQVKKAIMAVTDEADINQLQIEGRWHYRGMGRDELKGDLDNTYSQKVGYLTNQKKMWEGFKNINPKDTAYQMQVGQQIKLINDDLAANDNDYKDKLALLSSDPEAFKAKKYITDSIDQFADANSNQKTIEKIIANPYWEKYDKDRTFSLAVDRFNEEQRHNKADEGIGWGNLDVRRQELQMKTTGTGLILPGGLNLPNNLSEGVVHSTLQAVNQDLQTIPTLLNAEKLNFKQKYFPDMNPRDFDIWYEKYRNEYQHGGHINDYIGAHFDKVQGLQTQYDNTASMLDQIQKQADANPVFNTKQFEKGFHNVTFNGYTYTPTELSSIYEKIKNYQISNPNDIYKPIIYNDKKASEELNSKELALYNLDKKYFYSNKQLSAEERSVNEYVYNVWRGIGTDVSRTAKNKSQWINNEISSRMKEQYQPVVYSFSTEGNNNEITRKLFSDFATKAQMQGGKITGNPDFDLDKFSRLINAPYTKFKVMTQGNERKLMAVGYDDKGKVTDFQWVPATTDELQGELGSALGSPYQSSYDNIGMSGGRSTNVQHPVVFNDPDAWKTATFSKNNSSQSLDNFPRVNKYVIKADVAPISDGVWQTVFYVQSPSSKQWITIPGGKSANYDTNVASFQYMTDEQIDQLLSSKK